MFLTRCLHQGNKVFVTGIQPTGQLHLGNYLGFVDTFVRLQNVCFVVFNNRNQDNLEAKKFLFVADLHANSVRPKHPQFKRQCRRLVAAMIASGVDPCNTCLYYQSQVPEHAELAWHFGSLVNINKLMKLPQFKEKAVESFEGVSPNLLTYPVLQAADILLYKCTHVPVGEDQVMHVNLTLHILERIKEVFKTTVLSKVARVKSLSEPAKKMSKSDANQHATLFMEDTPDMIVKKTKRAKTDSTGKTVDYDPENRPGVSNLIDILAALHSQTPSEVAQSCSDLSTLDLKLKVADAVNQRFTPIREKFVEIVVDDEYLDRILTRNADEARQVAIQSLKEFKQIVGYDQPSASRSASQVVL